VNGRLKPTFRGIWFVGGGAVSSECLRLGLADELRYSIVPVELRHEILTRMATHEERQA